MMPLETERLMLRPLQINDFAAVHAYASVMENVQYMPFGPNTEEETKAFFERSIAQYSENSINDYVFAITLKDTNQVSGSCGITIKMDCEAVLGWILHRDYWKKALSPSLPMNSSVLDLKN